MECKILTPERHRHISHPTNCWCRGYLINSDLQQPNQVVMAPVLDELGLTIFQPSDDSTDTKRAPYVGNASYLVHILEYFVPSCFYNLHPSYAYSLHLIASLHTSHMWSAACKLLTHGPQFTLLRGFLQWCNGTGVPDCLRDLWWWEMGTRNDCYWRSSKNRLHICSL